MLPIARRLNRRQCVLQMRRRGQRLALALDAFHRATAGTESPTGRVLSQRSVTGPKRNEIWFVIQIETTDPRDRVEVGRVGRTCQAKRSLSERRRRGGLGGVTNQSNVQLAKSLTASARACADKARMCLESTIACARGGSPSMTDSGLWSDCRRSVEQHTSVLHHAAFFFDWSRRYRCRLARPRSCRLASRPCHASSTTSDYRSP